MKLDTPVRTLGPVNHRPLRDAVAAIDPAAWNEDTLRQDAFEQHRATQSIILMFASGWPQVKVEKRKGWDYFSTTAIPLMMEAVNGRYPPGGIILRAMIAKLVAGGEIAEHFDGHGTFDMSHRIHIPLVTNDQVDFKVRGENHKLLEGVAYEISNVDYHGVSNRSDQDRIHFIFDYAVR
ncbi:MAG: hypothetical protein GC155_14345 [Alphaproteobacteria bacterium]|nr:hypothetical protein [Alphaproteobacteria bacterium]